MFKNKHEIIEYLYCVKEKFDEHIENVNSEYISSFFDLIENEIPRSKFYDNDVKELIEDVSIFVFKSYSDFIQKLRISTNNLYMN